MTSSARQKCSATSTVGDGGLASSSHPPPTERRVLISVIAVTTSGVLPVFLFGGLAVQIAADLGLSPAAKGQVVAGYFGLSALTSAWSGRLTERFGSSRLMRSAALVGATSSFGVATARSALWLMIAVAIGGLANAFAQPAANALVVRSIPKARQGFALGIKQAAIPTATLLAGLAVPTVALTVGWRWAFAAAGGGALAALALTPTVYRPVSHQRRAIGTISGPLLRPLLVLSLGVGLGSAMANILGAFITSTAVVAGLGPGAAGLLLAAGSALGLSLRVGSGWMADRRGHGHVTAVAVMLFGGAVGVLGIASGMTGAVVIGTLLAFGSGWSWPGVFNLAVVNNYPSTPAAATGVTQTGSYTGGALGPLAMGAMVQQWGYPWAWLVVAFLALASGAVMLVGRALLAGLPDAHRTTAATSASA